MLWTYLGIDSKNKQVQDIIIKIRGEAGSLVGQDALVEARKKVDELNAPIHEKELEVEQLTAMIEKSSRRILSLQQEVVDVERRYNDMTGERESLASQIEQKWMDDPKQVIIWSRLREINMGHDQFQEV